MVCEVFGYEIVCCYMFVLFVNYVCVMVNGEYYGLFVNVELIDDVFFKCNYGIDEGIFICCVLNFVENEFVGCKVDVFGSLQFDESVKCYFYNFQLFLESGWDDFIELIYLLNKKLDEVYCVFNVDQAFWMLAYNNVLVNLSSYIGCYSENYYFYCDDQGWFNFIVFDFNFCFGSYKNIGVGFDFKLKDLQEMDFLLYVNNVDKLLISQLFKDEYYRKMYFDYICIIVNEVFCKDQYLEWVKEL